MFLLGKNSGIKQRVMAMALLPTLSITLLLGVFFTLTRLNDLDSVLFERSLATAEQFTAIAGYQVKNQDKQLLQDIANSALEKADVRSITIYDSNADQRVHSGPGMLSVISSDLRFSSHQQHLFTEQSIRIITPIFSLPTQSERAPVTEKSSPIGWHEMEFSTVNTEIKKYQTLLGSGVLIITGVLLNIFLAMRIGQNITHPLRKISNAVTHIRNGNLDTRINTDTGGELRVLESGINAMVSSLQQAHLEMQQNIDQSTNDLQETLETIEIQNIELDMARKEALEASRIKSEFLANMSHEIRTPLNGIIGFTNLLLRSNLADRQREYLQTIHTSSEGLLSIINDVLDFSKIEAGKLELESIPINLRETVEEVLSILAPAAHEKQLELVPLIYTDTPIHLIGDPLRIKQILINLVSNAIKFTQSGTITVRAMLEEQRGPRSIIKLSVTDTGIGLSLSQQKELFKAFSQADTSTTRRIGGTGLGLVISKRLAQQMGGDIGLESELDEGSTFWFTINVPMSPEQNEKYLDLEFPSRRVALLETQEISRQATGHLLTALKLEVSMFEHADELSAMQSDSAEMPDFDLIILSHNERNLPTDTLQRLLSLPWHEKTSFLILVDTHKEHDISRILGSTPNIVTMGKPLVRARLYKTISQFFEVTSDKSSHKPNEQLVTQTSLVQHTPHILAVDDNAANLKLITVLLETMGVKVSAVDSGQLAISQIRQHRFDMVFMDVQMPDMDGMDTTRYIRDLEIADQRTPIIALTAHALATEKKVLLLAGMDDYMSKPISEPQLQQMIKKWTGIHLHLLEEMPEEMPERMPYKAVPSLPKVQKELIDIQEGIQLAGGKADLAEEMLEMLFENLPEDCQKINQLYADQLYSEMLETVHKLHGATRYCGVPKLRQACYDMESALKQHAAETLSSRHLRMPAEQLTKELDALINWYQEREESTTKATT